MKSRIIALIVFLLIISGCAGSGIKRIHRIIRIPAIIRIRNIAGIKDPIARRHRNDRHSLAKL